MKRGLSESSSRAARSFFRMTFRLPSKSTKVHSRHSTVGRSWRLNRHAFNCYQSNKTVASPRNGFNEAWIIGIVVEGGTEFFQNDIQAAVEVDKSSLPALDCWPKLAAQPPCFQLLPEQ